jgi:hypothetical protein
MSRLRSKRLHLLLMAAKAIRISQATLRGKNISITTDEAAHEKRTKTPGQLSL